MSSTRADPITLEIIQSSLQAVSDEMFAALRKTAMSAIIYEVLDMGTSAAATRDRSTTQVVVLGQRPGARGGWRAAGSVRLA